MSLKFTQEEVERELADIIGHGDRVELARVSGLSESYIKRQFNADDHEAVSSAFRLLQIGCALDQIDADKGERFWQTLMRFRGLSIPDAGGTDASKASARLNTETAEFINARLDGQPFMDQLRELGDIERAVQVAKQALFAEFNESKAQPRSLRRVK